MYRFYLGYVTLLFLLLLPAMAKAEDDAASSDFAKGVREADPQSPEAELMTFRLPKGFRAQLFAAEPDIAKPLNMAFDARGRLWITDTLEYPYPVEVGKPGRDSIKILEDTNHDGRADVVTTFADGLNIPIGLYPYRDGVVCYSIPNIWFLRDTDGDGQCDQREILYGPFDHTRDTHGMCNAFTRGFDGWVYACHGFNNQSSVSGLDGHTVTMHSGNTFRFRLDGSRIEHFTHGQVNPFGMSFDARGDLLTADCHTKPVTLLLHGGYSESFGKPHDGLGFVPPVMNHLHGSTAIGGIAVAHRGNGWPDEFANNTFGGNVMTSRINRNSLQYDGASVRAQEKADFLISSDSWFRPVDLQMGPDESLYVADFYNRIIGHYEVPLDHPGRDRYRGRIWRISYVGSAEDAQPNSAAEPAIKVTDLNARQLVARFQSRSHTTRMLALDRLVDELDEEATAAARDGLENSSAQVRLHCLWALAQRKALKSSELRRATQDNHPLVRTHAQKILGSRGVPSDLPYENRSLWITAGLSDNSPLVCRASATACNSVRDPSLAKALLRCLDEVSPTDVHLRHALRIGLKHQLQDEITLRSVVAGLDSRHDQLVADVCLAIPQASAANFLVSRLATLAKSAPTQQVRYVQHAARHMTAEAIPQFIETIRHQDTLDAQFQFDLIRSVQESLRQRREALPSSLKQWAAELVGRWLTLDEKQPKLSWQSLPHPEHVNNKATWDVSSRRKSDDGQEPSTLWSSFPHGEQRTGVFRSSSFPLAETFGFYIAGHDGYPDQKLQGKNLVRLRDAHTHEILRSWSPPRQDVAVSRSWNAKHLEGRQVYVELVDGDTAGAYAWMAVGRFTEDRLNPHALDRQRRKACQLVTSFELHEMQPVLHQLLLQSLNDLPTRTLLSDTLASLDATSLRTSIAESLRIATLSEQDQQQAVKLVTADDVDAVATVKYLTAALKFASSAEQQKIAESLAADRRGLELLIRLAEDQALDPRCLTRTAVQSKAEAIASVQQKTKIRSITVDLPSEAETVSTAIQKQKSHFLRRGGVPARGKEIFAKQCSICHQVNGQGKQVGPNLDGIGNRGLDRLVEDVLAPNRNIDVAFRATTIVTSDGLAITGLIQGINGGILNLVDSQAKLHSIPTSQIEEQSTLVISPMPANFHDLLNEDQRSNLLSYLLSLRNR